MRLTFTRKPCGRKDFSAWIYETLKGTFLMKKAVTIYHNPRCSKSRQTLALLEEKGVAPKVVEYLKAPPSAAELKRILKKLGLKAHDIVRKGEAVYAEVGLKDRDVSDDELLALMAENPILIERPIVVAGDRAAIGRPPENVLAIL
jgi:arsenate reductase